MCVITYKTVITQIRILVYVLCVSLEICQQRIDKAIGATDKIRLQKYLLRYHSARNSKLI